jgi:vesicle transport through interaction with t-SNAREs protein 1
MADLLDSEAGSELFSSYEAELKLVQADLNQKLDQIPELNGEPRKAAIGQAERAVEEAKEIVSTSKATSRTEAIAIIFPGDIMC